MTKSSSSSNKALLLAVLMAVSVPSAALAWEEGSPDSILTVSVNMGSSDAGDNDDEDGGSCTGFATMELSSSTLQSRPDKIQPAIATPNIQQRLAALAMTQATFTTLSLGDTEDGAGGDLILTKSSQVSGSWIINPEWIQLNPRNEAIASELAQMDLSDHDFEIPVSFSAETPSLAMIDRRTYVTSPFTVTYDATTCESDGEARAEIDVMRTEVQARTISNGDGNWSSVELPSRDGSVDCCWDDQSSQQYLLYLSSSAAAYDVATLRELAADGLFKGEAYLLKSRTASDGDRRLIPVAMRPNDFYNYGEDDDGLDLYGSSGTATLRAVTKLYGELSQNAQLRTQYGFWMEVFPYGN
jgi:hypothetical protein